MRTYLARWPDGTISILMADTLVELYDRLDEEGQPEFAKVFYCPRGFHISASAKMDGIFVDAWKGKLKRIRWPEDIFEQVYSPETAAAKKN